MNVLITGGYGFIGSAVAERFHKEGHRVFIIDNLSSGSSSNLTIPHKSYKLNVEDQACAEVFRSTGFDVVVHLAADTSVTASSARPDTATQTNILGLVNMLNCSRLYGAKKFIFASSAAVYGDTAIVPVKEEHPCAPLSLYGLSKLHGEMYCKQWREQYNLNTLCFRFSNVYGPRQRNDLEGGVVSIFLDHARDGKQPVIYGDGNQTRDFIYVDDVADAIYRGAMSDVSGVYNLSTGTETSVNELIDRIGELVPMARPLYLAARVGEIARSCLDSSRLKRDLDWVPLYTLEEGLAGTYRWMQAREPAEQTVSEQKEKRPSLARSWFRIIRPYVENALAFSVVFALARADMFQQSPIDYRLVYILLMGLLYGSRQSLPAAAAVIGLIVGTSIHYGRDWGSLLYDPESLFTMALYLFFGLAVGFVKDGHYKERNFARNEMLLMEQRYRFLETVYKDMRSVKEELQRQVLASKDSLGRFHSLIEELESFEPDQVVVSSVSVLEDILETKRISVYAVGKSGYLRLLAKSNDPDFQAMRSIRLDQLPKLAEVVDRQTVWLNKELDPELPMLAAPVVHEGETIALVCVHDQPFEKFSLYYENLFKVAVSLVSRSLSRALTYVAATRNERYIEQTPVMREAAFGEVLRSKISAKERNCSDFVVLSVDSAGRDWKETAEALYRLLRDTDYIGMRRGQLALLLSNSGLEEARAAMERLRRNGIRTTFMDEELVYD